MDDREETKKDNRNGVAPKWVAEKRTDGVAYVWIERLLRAEVQHVGKATFDGFDQGWVCRIFRKKDDQWTVCRRGFKSLRAAKSFAMLMLPIMRLHH